MSDSARNTISLWGTLLLIVGVLGICWSQMAEDDTIREKERAKFIYKTQISKVNNARQTYQAGYNIYPPAPHLLKAKKRKRMYEMLLEEEEEWDF